MSLSDLIARLEGLTEPSREIDADVGRYLGITPKTKNVLKRGHYVSSKAVVLRTEEVWPRFTADMHAALTLRPEGWTAWEVASRGGLTRYCAEISRWKSIADEEAVIGRSTHPAIALLIACLKAREADNP